MIPILECQTLTKRYGQLEALSDVTLRLPRGRIIGLLGPNGSGKSTLIKMTAGLLTPSAGTLLIDGKPVGPETKKIVSYLPDRNYLNDWMKIRELISFLHDFYPDLDKTKANDMLKRLQIDPEKRMKTLSKGTKEKVQLIMVMSRSADLYLLDEPIGGVDPAARDYILDTIISNYNENSTVVISTHLIADVEKVLDEVVFLAYGRVALQATVDQIREEQGKSVDALFREVYKC